VTAAKLELRPVIAVYHHVRRMYDEKKHKGKWLPDEDTLLEELAIFVNSLFLI
jgi:hypothetical protein